MWSCKLFGSVAGTSLSFMLGKDNAPGAECNCIIKMAAFILSWERTNNYISPEE